jgi:hypothetical protein
MLQENHSKTGKLRACSKITRPHLGFKRDKSHFSVSLEFLLRFGSIQNEEPLRLEE